MHNGICPVCGTAKIYCKSGGVMVAPSREELALLEYGPGLFSQMTRADILAFVCEQCGHLTFAVDPKDRARIPEIIQHGKWTYVPPPKQQD